jgi:intein/homing endonuclease
MRRLLGELAPDRYEDIVAACALYRPGPIQGGMVKDYVARRHGRTRVEYLHPALEATTGDTYGVWCIAAGQRVLTSSGWREIERVGRGDMVMTQSGDWHEVRARHDNGTRDTFAVRMTNGEELIATSEHKILTARGWVAVCDLTRSDLVQQVWGSDEEIPDGDDRDWIVGLALADGDLCGATPTISCSSREFAERVKTIADAAWGLDCAVYFAGRAWYVALTAGRGAVGVARPNPFTRHLRRLGLLGCDFSTKFFPQRVSLSMAAGFYEGDGSTLNNRLRVKNEALARRFWEILQARRIDSSLFIDKGDVWTVAVSGRLPLRLKVKGEIFGGYVPKPDLSFIPRSDERRQLRWNKRSFITKEALRRISEDYDRDLVPSTPWGRVLAVRPCGARRVYDLTVDTDHSYVVGGSLVHNCYQEQVMAAARALAGYTLGQADILRKAMGKKKPEVMAKERAKFVAGCVRMGSCDEARATELFELVAKWAGYGFNKSVDADTLIRDTSGNEKRLADFVPGDLVWSLGMEGNREQTSVVAVHDHGVLDGFAVEFDDGTAVVCTLDHKFLTEQGQKPLWQIVADDSEVLSVGTPNENDRGAVRRDDEEWADFCASEHAPIADTRRLVRRRVVRVLPVGPRSQARNHRRGRPLDGESVGDRAPHLKLTGRGRARTARVEADLHPAREAGFPGALPEGRLLKLNVGARSDRAGPQRLQRGIRAGLVGLAVRDDRELSVRPRSVLRVHRERAEPRRVEAVRVDGVDRRVPLHEQHGLARVRRLGARPRERIAPDPEPDFQLDARRKLDRRRDGELHGVATTQDERRSLVDRDDRIEPGRERLPEHRAHPEPPDAFERVRTSLGDLDRSHGRPRTRRVARWLLDEEAADHAHEPADRVHAHDVAVRQQLGGRRRLLGAFP